MAVRALMCLLALPAVLASSPPCRYIPGDAGWPSRRDWARLNATVGGRLIATVPVAHVCHKTGPFSAYDEGACEDLVEAFQDAGPETLCTVPGEIFNPYWQNDSCSPFTSPWAPCRLGNRAVYSINVTGPADVQAGLKFAAKNNIRLVIKNTGIDYLGKSTGKGALALWTYNLKTIEIIANYKSSFYSGPAVKLGAGIIAGEAYKAVHEAGYRIVAPECGLVGVVGGYLQGVGQSQLITAYGLAADQVLEWELVTPRGEYLTATPEKNKDLYWALAGGGGGTYGVVLSATLKAYPDGPVAGGEMVFRSQNTTAFWEAVEIWYNQGPSHVNSTRDNIQFIVGNDALTVLCFVMPDQKGSAIDHLMATFIPELDRLNIPYNYTVIEYPTYVDSFVAYYGDLPYGTLCPSFPIISSRLVPRSTVLDKTANKNLMNVFRNITEDGNWFIGCSFFSVDDSPGSIRPPHPPNSIHPAWRDAIAYCNPQTYVGYNWDDPQKTLEMRQRLVNDLLPALEAATPGSGLQNELDPTYKGDWKQGLYGAHYDRLLEIKHKYDPDHLMYGLFAVGSDEFVLDGRGRLCRA
ncbi:Bifunctional solanapyrone synthase [Madurella mycetomatis]|uniref:Bifunctional solanapyrone synthase n=1 Tax=Madurella mycetomatis TaxID=100816 RepID=A0A175VXL5_9PEZI|nr:Bifunctional solanapyrone synthase [Madurella mycetomatis]